MNGTGVFDWAWARQRKLRHWGCHAANRTHLDSILDSLAVAGAAVVKPLHGVMMRLGSPFEEDGHGGLGLWRAMSH